MISGQEKCEPGSASIMATTVVDAAGLPPGWKRGSVLSRNTFRYLGRPRLAKSGT